MRSSRMITQIFGRRRRRNQTNLLSLLTKQFQRRRANSSSIIIISNYSLFPTEHKNNHESNQSIISCCYQSIIRRRISIHKCMDGSIYLFFHLSERNYRFSQISERNYFQSIHSVQRERRKRKKRKKEILIEFDLSPSFGQGDQYVYIFVNDSIYMSMSTRSVVYRHSNSYFVDYDYMKKKSSPIIDENSIFLL